MTKEQVDVFLRRVKSEYPNFWEGESKDSKRLLYDEWLQALAPVPEDAADEALREWMARWDYMAPTPHKFAAKCQQNATVSSEITPLMREAIRRLEDGGD